MPLNQQNVLKVSHCQYSITLLCILKITKIKCAKLSKNFGGLNVPKTANFFFQFIKKKLQIFLHKVADIFTKIVPSSILMALLCTY